MTHPVTIQDRRQRYLDWLYVQDGRTFKDHPMHGLYCGLYQTRIRDLFDFDQRIALGDIE